jgi:hypothetical protein
VIVSERSDGSGHGNTAAHKRKETAQMAKQTKAPKADTVAKASTASQAAGKTTGALPLAKAPINLDDVLAYIETLPRARTS